jgi:hypothetical protein
VAIQNTDRTLEDRLVSLESLWFLADTPMFVDGVLISRLYDAVFRPEVEIASHSDADTKELAGKVSAIAKASGEAQIQVPPWLAAFGLDVAKAKAAFEASASGEGSKRNANTATSTYLVVKSDERYLEKVVSLYVQKYRRRLFWVSGNLDGGRSLAEPHRHLTWQEMEGELDKPGPRPLVILDFPKGSKLMPTYGELANAKGCPLVADYLAKRVKNQEGYAMPRYPSGDMTMEDRTNKRREYWQQVHHGFDSQAVQQTVEAAAGEEKSRFDWIDFRALVDLDQVPALREPPHLHFVSRGEHSTGTFAYQMVRRADRFGIRMIGTLKSGQDINVMAVYER